jgi:hypothetical protein
MITTKQQNINDKPLTTTTIDLMKRSKGPFGRKTRRPIRRPLIILISSQQQIGNLSRNQADERRYTYKRWQAID